MSAKRFFVKNVEDVTHVSGEEFKHAVTVLRINLFDDVVLLDNSGYEYLGKVVSLTKKEMTVKIEKKQFNEFEAKTPVTLICGYLKGDKTEYVVQKAVELGVTKIVTFSSEFSSAYMSENKLERLNRVSMEASKQCGRAVFPEVLYAPDFQTALSYGESAKNKIFACEFATENATDLSCLSGETAIVIGSEGGFSQREAELAKNLGYTTLWLGKRILRADTACISAVTLVMHSLGELG